MNRIKIIADTKNWIKDFVLKYNLCPFAYHPFNEGKIRFTLIDSESMNDLVQKLLFEFQFLLETPSSEIETSLIIHPNLLLDFLDYNDFLYEANDLLEKTELAGILQIASFHPDYQFADTKYDDSTNRTNRSPYPMLHLLREASIQKAVDDYGDTDEIWKRNLEIMRELPT